MALTYTRDFKGQANGVAAAIASNTLTAQVGDVITVTAVAGNIVDITAFTIANNNTAISWEQIANNFTASNCGLRAWKGTVVGTPPTTVTVTASAGASTSASKCIAVQVSRGTHPINPVPSANIFTGASLTDVSRAIAPTANGSALWMVCAGFSATNTFAAGANCTIDDTYHEAGQMTVIALRPTTQPRVDTTSFTLSETDTGDVVAYIAFEIQASDAVSSDTREVDLVQESGWIPQRWDFPLDATFLFDDFLPSTAPAGSLTGSTTLTFTATGSLTGDGALTGSTTITFSPTSTLTGSAPATGSSSLTFSPTGTLIGIGALTGSTSLTFSPTSTLTGSGALTGATTLTFAPTSSLTGTGALTGTASITFSPIGTLADATSGLTGSSSITFTVTGTLTGSGALAGVTTLTFTPTGILADASAPVVAAEQNSAGYGFYFDFEYHREQRKRRKKREEELQREADEIQADLDREIAKLLRAQEAKDAERADLARIQAMADKFAGTRQQVPRNIAASLLKAQEERSRNALEQLYREMDREMEAEEVFALLLILNQ